MRITKKKLDLNRETVLRLEPDALREVLGGIVSSDNAGCTYSRRCQEQGFGKADA